MQPEGILFILITFSVISGFGAKKYIFDVAQKFIKNSAKAKAKITSIQLVKNGKYSHFKISIIFKDQLGAEIISETKANIVKNKYHEGDEIDILYLKTDPKRVKMSDFPKTVDLTNKILTVALIILTAVLMIMLYEGIAQIPFI